MFYVLPLRTHYVLLSRKSKHKTYVLSKQQGQRAKNHKVLSENYCVMVSHRNQRSPKFDPSGVFQPKDDAKSQIRGKVSGKKDRWYL